MELSDEQQEIVSGGISLMDMISTDFDFSKESLAFKAEATSGPMGSNVSQLVAADKADLFTSASKDFSLNFNPGDFIKF
nr:CTB family bacteriocin [Myxacorys almedinensis]